MRSLLAAALWAVPAALPAAASTKAKTAPRVTAAAAAAPAQAHVPALAPSILAPAAAESPAPVPSAPSGAESLDNAAVAAAAKPEELRPALDAVYDSKALESWENEGGPPRVEAERGEPVPLAPAAKRPRKSKLRRALETVTAPFKLITNSPRNERDWSPDVAVLPSAEFKGDRVTVRNVRSFKYKTSKDFTPAWYDKSFDLADVKSVWYGVEPFGKEGGPAHTFLSFGLKDGSFLAVSVEIRRKKGEIFSAWKGLWNNYEIVYVVADERDVIKLRTNHRKSDVYLYETKLETPKSAGLLLADMLRRANALKDKPEFYNSLYNTCTTSILRHVNNVAPKKKRLPWSRDVLLPAGSDKLAYEHGFLDRSKPFAELKRLAHITKRAQAAGEADDFSRRIRGL